MERSEILTGLKVVEFSNEMGAWAGKLLADAGADVVLVEPPGGALTRTYEPFYKDTPDPNGSLYFWHYNTSKRSITINVQNEQGRDLLKRLLATADVFIECEQPGALPALGLGYDDVKDINPRLVYISITPYGQAHPELPATDLTILADGGPIWSCGYDDHSLPPVRGGGNQGYQTACHFAVLSALSALLYRGVSNKGQYIDVNAVAASNVSTEGATYQWTVAGATVQRQTGRHAGVTPSPAASVRCADGRYVNGSLPPRTPEAFRQIRDWLASHNLIDQFPLAEVLTMGAEGGPIEVFSTDDPEVAMKLEAGREGLNLLAQSLPAYQFFTEGQERNFQVSIVYTPEEAMQDKHILARGFPAQVEHPEIGQSFTYPGNPYKFRETPWKISRRAPLVGEDTAEILGELGIGSEQVGSLTRAGAI